MSPAMVALLGLVAVVFLGAVTSAWLVLRRARQRSREINTQIVELHRELHDRIHEANTRLDDLARLEKLARIDRATSAVHHAASEGQLPAESRKKILRHLQDVRDELSASEPLA